MTEFKTIWEEHPVMVILTTVGLGLYIIGLLFMSIGPLTEEGTSTSVIMFTATLTLGGILISTFSIMLIAFDVGLKKASPEAFNVKIVQHPDEIWENSIRILNELRDGKYFDKHAFDVTSFLNKIRYEEAIVSVLDAGITFDRIFCYNEKNKNQITMAMSWFHKKIIEGEEIKEKEIDNIELELKRAFKEKTTDKIPKKLDKSNIERLRKIIERLHEHFNSNLLTLKHVHHPVNVDFVLSEYIPKVGENPTHEVMANFKTSLRGETYAMGTVAKGTLARGYKEMFSGVI